MKCHPRLRIVLATTTTTQIYYKVNEFVDDATESMRHAQYHCHKTLPLGPTATIFSFLSSNHKHHHSMPYPRAISRLLINFLIFQISTFRSADVSSPDILIKFPIKSPFHVQHTRRRKLKRFAFRELSTAIGYFHNVEQPNTDTIYLQNNRLG